MPARTRSVFWEDLDKQLEDREFRRHFILERNRIQTVDRMMNLIIEALGESGLTRADIARAIGTHSSAVRRLLNQRPGPVNPTLQTLSDVAAVLGFQIELVPMKPQTRHEVTELLMDEASAGAGAVPSSQRQRRGAPAA